MLPADVVGVVAEFVCELLADTVPLTLVSSAWMQGVESNDSLWHRLTLLTWPDAPPRAGRKPLLKARMLRARGIVNRTKGYKGATAASLAIDSLTPIEECAFEFRCPLFVEDLRALSDADRAALTPNPVFFCDVCRENVFAVTSQAELDDYAKRGKCVIFKAKPSGASLSSLFMTHRGIVHVVGKTRDIALDFIAAIKAELLHRRGGDVTGGIDGFIWNNWAPVQYFAAAPSPDSPSVVEIPAPATRVGEAVTVLVLECPGDVGAAPWMPKIKTPEFVVCNIERNIRSAIAAIELTSSSLIEEPVVMMGKPARYDNKSSSKCACQ